MDKKIFEPINKKYFVLSLLYGIIFCATTFFFFVASENPLYPEFSVNYLLYCSLFFIIFPSLVFGMVLHFKKTPIVILASILVSILLAYLTFKTGIVNMIFPSNSAREFWGISVFMILIWSYVITAFAIFAAFMLRISLASFPKVTLIFIIILPITICGLGFYMAYDYKQLTAEKCSRIDKYWVQTDCYFKLADQSNNALYCFMATGDYPHKITKDCLDRISSKTPQNFQICKDLNGHAHEACIWDFAIKDHDASICSKAERSEDCVKAVIIPGTDFY